MAGNSEEGQGPQRAVVPMMMMTGLTPNFADLNLLNYHVWNKLKQCMKATENSFTFWIYYNKEVKICGLWCITR
jgi:hypothetical protein